MRVMTKLNNAIRKIIALRAIEAAFGPRKDVLLKTEDALAREAYTFLIPPTEIKAVAKVPENWFRRDRCLRFNVGGQTLLLNLLGEGLPTPYQNSNSSGYGCHVLGVIPHGDLCDRIQAHAQALLRLTEERRQAHNQLSAMLGSITTLGKLKAAWPEGAEFYAEFDNKKSSNLPAIRFGEINKMLGIDPIVTEEGRS